ncbi:MAG: hypothetical protein NE330_17175 [Lentisphaeraceae bacterium]|nr:hypothetical protein [Lentisphaeraceae bacterium]
MNNQLLFDGYLRDDLNKEEQEQLLSLIESDTTVRSQFIEHIHFSSLQVSVSLNLETGKSRTKRLKPQGNNKLVLWSTVLVAALVCLGVFISWSHQKPKISF